MKTSRGEAERHLPSSSPSLETRAVRFEDVAGLLRLIERAVEQGCRRHYDSRQRDAVYRVYAQSLFVEALGPFATVVAEDAGRIVGMAQLDPGDQRLRALFVEAGFQRRGAGRALLAEVERQAIEAGFNRLHGAMSLNAVSFYRNAGFHPCGGADTLIAAGVPVPVVRMQKHLGALIADPQG